MKTFDPPSHLEEFSAFLPALNKESDRGMVLIATSYLDELMRRTLLAFLIEDAGSVALVDGFNAPIGSLATRSATAMALGLISLNEKTEIDLLRKIRNKFAHHIHVSFEDVNIKELCGRLDYSAKNYGDVIVEARGQFLTSATSLILKLINRPHYVTQRRAQHRNWPY